MDGLKVNFIIDAIADRLRYHDITMSENEITELQQCLEKFHDDDYYEATDALTDSIYEKLHSFGIPEHVSRRCSWKWSD